mmetsp:Transcript_44042/g.61908  ORF Transcript_44042/g.61908 Transcript_44042/m.61908 type:complete len:153 (+) Transcript_44042:40-498(+)|eukprot:CAMPEP_0201488520 /NCGR_PEP_ID=MMETSP0151_2-20130828/18728_1 /ASSEMBLY_ACC=CAM_ASM_000257 /TAXON_ID=200890 /ORGANISM="Paramoeba atlantica, Strain 621/1 / CCAP 1560/9" /LENGTH=152 /DNA_ID=CAMNT_0047873833 /DNA_START=30 /DNA_END=488 /DNA_ORIENTATION=-
MASRRRRGGESASEENLDDVFKVFDQTGAGKLPAEQIGTLIRASGKNPSEKDVQEMIDELGGVKGSFTLDKFKELSRRKMPKPMDQENEMRNAFNALDREGGGYVLEGELRGLLSSLGDALSSSELDAAMRAAKIGPGGEVFYDDFVTNLCK